ncbi:Peroxisomal membrane protein, putative [Cryptococcus gattii WM276]|uniref:Peroxisomal membrane protein, putative n=1 Tax=Cryptococcus gattii serotype B (strain WM276 / ATCC MYA-4071) TaxID=367775 RepID=E6R972_CRYGW|nr:Peroxisomal membrane protein, putative [Cryptococcus gattii WM276]ADV23371.1 Peroxisomal membrane protein, putative [Cryptococcus gattii WM276]
MGDSVIHAFAGSVGGCAAMALTYPLVTLSTRAAVQTKKEHMTVKEALVKAYIEEGIGGLYSGLGSSLFGIALTNGVYYAFYEETRSALIRRRSKTPASSGGLTTKEGIIAGLVAGSITTIVTNPIWTVQTAQATYTADPLSKTDKKQDIKPSAMRVVKGIIEKDGIKGLWRGIGPALVLVVNPVIQYTTFERLVTALLKYRLLSHGATPVGKTALGRSSLSDWDFFILGAASKLVATSSTYPYQAATHQYKSSFRAILHILRAEGVSGLYAGLTLKLLQSVLTAAFMFAAQRRIYVLVKYLLNLSVRKRKAVVALG